MYLGEGSLVQNIMFKLRLEGREESGGNFLLHQGI